MQNLKQVKIDWGNLRPDPELDKLLTPLRPLGAEFARRAERLVREWRSAMRKDPLIIRWAESEAPYMEWRDLEYDPDLIKKELL